MAHVTINSVDVGRQVLNFLIPRYQKIIAVVEMAGHEHMHMGVGEPDSMSSEECEALRSAIKRGVSRTDAARMMSVSRFGRPASKNGNSGTFYLWKGYREVVKHTEYEGPPRIEFARGWSDDEQQEQRRLAANWLRQAQQRGASGTSIVHYLIEHAENAYPSSFVLGRDIANKQREYYISHTQPFPSQAQLEGAWNVSSAIVARRLGLEDEMFLPTVLSKKFERLEQEFLRRQGPLL